MLWHAMAYGKAPAALLKFLAKNGDVLKSTFDVVTGATPRRKTVLIEGAKVTVKAE